MKSWLLECQNPQQGELAAPYQTILGVMQLKANHPEVSAETDYHRGQSGFVFTLVGYATSESGTVWHWTLPGRGLLLSR
eukprot:scaffold386332_cov34-Prasinocladus_malaysianus.AAC.1